MFWVPRSRDIITFCKMTTIYFNYNNNNFTVFSDVKFRTREWHTISRKYYFSLNWLLYVHFVLLEEMYQLSKLNRFINNLNKTKHKVTFVCRSQFYIHNPRVSDYMDTCLFCGLCGPTGYGGACFHKTMQICNVTNGGNINNSIDDCQ